MARSVFFSFHYERDIWRVNQVRNSWVTKPNINIAGFIDATAWEDVERRGDSAIRRWIDNQLIGTSVTVVLIGAETAGRDYVNYEIEQSLNKGNGLLGIYIHRLKDNDGYADYQGDNPFFNFTITDKFGYERNLADYVEIYDWVLDDGYNNLGDWVERAAENIGR